MIRNSFPYFEFNTISSHCYFPAVSSPIKFLRVISEPGYAQLVFSAKGNANLFSHKAIVELCNFQTHIGSLPNYQRQCITDSSGNCCNMWSLPNYITHLLKLENCGQITVSIARGHCMDLFAIITYDVRTFANTRRKRT